MSLSDDDKAFDPSFQKPAHLVQSRIVDCLDTSHDERVVLILQLALHRLDQGREILMTQGWYEGADRPRSRRSERLRCTVRHPIEQLRCTIDARTELVRNELRH